MYIYIIYIYIYIYRYTHIYDDKMRVMHHSYWLALHTVSFYKPSSTTGTRF